MKGGLCCHDATAACPHPANEGLVIMVQISRIFVPPFFSGSPCLSVRACIENMLYARAGLFRCFFCGRISCYVSIFVRVNHHTFMTSVTPFQILVVIVVRVSVLMANIRISIRIFDKSGRRDLRNGPIIEPSIGSIQCNGVPFSRLQIFLASYGPDFSGLINFVFAKARYTFSLHSVPHSILDFDVRNENI